MELVCDNITYGYTRNSPVIEDFSYTFRSGITVLKGYVAMAMSALRCEIKEAAFGVFRL